MNDEQFQDFSLKFNKSVCVSEIVNDRLRQRIFCKIVFWQKRCLYSFWKSL